MLLFLPGVVKKQIMFIIVEKLHFLLLKNSDVGINIFTPSICFAVTQLSSIGTISCVTINSKCRCRSKIFLSQKNYLSTTIATP